MKVLVSSSQHFVLTPGGDLWVANAAESYRFWARYLEVYDEVHLYVRTTCQPTPPDGWILASGCGVKPVPLPDFYGPIGFMRHYLSLRQMARQTLEQTEAILLRIPCPVGNEVWRLLVPQRPYGIEVISDPYDVFAVGAVSHPLRPFFRWYFPHMLRKQCQRACAAAYVTTTALQRRYPPGSITLETSYSDVELSDTAFTKRPRSAATEKAPIRLIMVGSLRQLYKAPHMLLEAMSICVQRHKLNLELVIVGDGQYREQLEQQAATSGLAQYVHFAGQLVLRDDVISQLDQADLFILPSLTEGLPRAMIEAMARALPCIGSAVGGIPELLPTEDMVPPGDATALADKIYEVVTNPARMACMSAANLNKARAFHEDFLRERRIAFYQYVKRQTEKWLSDKK